MKNKIDKIPKISKKLNSNNSFVYKNIIVQNKILDSNCEGFNNIRLNNGFICEENSCKVEGEKQKSKSYENGGKFNIDSRGSIPSVNLNIENKQPSKENKIQEINKKLEVMKPSINKAKKEIIDDGEKLTCFQKFCGVGKK